MYNPGPSFYIAEKLIPILVTKKITEKELAFRIKNLELPLKGTKSIRQAQVCQGGVSVSEINEKTMESKRCPGIYFAGEVIDVDGICGGYNLQWVQRSSLPEWSLRWHVRKHYL